MRKELTTQVGADGVLTLTLPLGLADANRTVRVIVETVEEAPSRAALSQEEWRNFINETAGKWQGDFERPPQGEYEERDPL